MLTNASNTQLDHFRKHLHHNVIRLLIAARVTRLTNSPHNIINNNTHQLITKTSAHPLHGTLYTKMCETCFILFIYLFWLGLGVSAVQPRKALKDGAHKTYSLLSIPPSTKHLLDHRLRSRDRNNTHRCEVFIENTPQVSFHERVRLIVWSFWVVSGTAEDPYADLNDVVHNQKRNSSSKKKKDNCKQQ